MPVTAIKIESESEGIKTLRRLKFMTVADEQGLILDVYLCDEEFIPVNRINGGIFRDPPVIEQEYHTKLRKESFEKNQFVAEESTNPEWNPIENTENI